MKLNENQLSEYQKIALKRFRSRRSISIASFRRKRLRLRQLLEKQKLFASIGRA